MLLGISLIFGGKINPSVFAQNQDSQTNLKLKKIKVFDGFHKGYFSPDGTKLALMDEDKIKIINLQSGKNICERKITSASLLLSSPFSPDGKMIAVNYYIYNEKTREIVGHIDLLDSSACSEIKKYTGTSSSRRFGSYTSFSLDGSKIAVSADKPQIWNIEKNETAEYQKSIPEQYKNQNALISLDGRWLASYSKAFIPPDSFGYFSITDLQTKENKVLNKDLVIDFTFSADSGLLVITNSDFSKSSVSPTVVAKIYEVGNWKLLQTIPDTSAINAVAISPDKTLLACGGIGTFKIFSLKTGELLAEEYHYKRTQKDDFYGVPHLISFLTQVEFSPDGKTLLTGGEDGTVKLWQITK
jgi:WD40 repeat protein